MMIINHWVIGYTIFRQTQIQQCSFRDTAQALVFSFLMTCCSAGMMRRPPAVDTSRHVTSGILQIGWGCSSRICKRMYSIAINIYIYTYNHIYIYVYATIYIYVYIYICIYVYIYIYMYIYICVYIYTYVCIFICITQSQLHPQVDFEW